MTMFILFTLILYWFNGVIHMVSGFRYNNDLKIVLGFINLLTGTISIFATIKIMIEYGIH